MGKLSLNGKDLRKIGYPESKVIGIAIQVMHQYYKHSAEAEAIDILKDVLAAPDAYLEDAALGKIAAALLDEIRPKNDVIPLEQKRKRLDGSISGCLFLLIKDSSSIFSLKTVNIICMLTVYCRMRN